MNLFEEQQHEFASRHIGTNNEDDTNEMLKVIGTGSLKELIIRERLLREKEVRSLLGK